MAKPTPTPKSDDSAKIERLESWKEIAAYLRHGERTVRRWEATEGLPVHRHLHEKRGSVYAFRSELDQWREGRRLSAPASDGSMIASDRRQRPSGSMLLALGAIGCGLFALWWLLPASNLPPTEAPSPFTSYLGSELDPAFSPDGDHVAFRWSGDQQRNYDIYTRPVELDRLFRLTTNPFDEFSPAWSSDGRTIAFLRAIASDRVSVIAVPATGGPERQLAEFFNDPAICFKFPVRFLAWHPKRRLLVVAGRESAASPYALWAVEDDGRKRRLTNPPQQAVLGDLNPAFPPDGTTLMFTRGNTRFTCELHMLPLTPDGMAGGEPASIAPGVVSVVAPTWIGANEVVFHRFLEQGLWRMPLSNGASPKPLEFARWSAEGPAFSRRSNTLLYAAGGPDYNIWRLDFAALDRLAAQPTRAIASTRQEFASAVSPDGSRMALTSSRSGRHQIWVSDLNGGNPVRLTHSDEEDSGMPAWSPDGRWVVFESRRNGRVDVFAASVSDGADRQLTTNPADDLAPSWSRDGAWIYFSSNRSGHWDVRKIHWETGEEVLVAERGLGARESPNGRYLYYVRLEEGTAHGRLWRRDLRWGSEEPLISGYPISYHAFLALDDAVYFIADDQLSGQRALFMMQLVSQAVRRVTLFGDAYVCCPDMTPDHKQMFLTRDDEKSYDLVMVENFR